MPQRTAKSVLRCYCDFETFSRPGLTGEEEAPKVSKAHFAFLLTPEQTVNKTSNLECRKRFRPEDALLLCRASSRSISGSQCMPRCPTRPANGGMDHFGGSGPTLAGTSCGANFQLHWLAGGEGSTEEFPGDVLMNSIGPLLRKRNPHRPARSPAATEPSKYVFYKAHRGNDCQRRANCDCPNVLDNSEFR